MPSHLPRAALGLCLLAACPAATAAEVYQWKDANGVTQYSQTPPPKGAYQLRAIGSNGDAAPTPQIVAAAAKESPQCVTARKNIELLQGTGDVQLDTDNDGKPDTVLSADDRLNQLELARAGVKATCPAGTLLTTP